MASKEAQTNNKSDLITKDAMYLFELMRDSPQPILVSISSPCFIFPGGTPTPAT
jgi:hypothetical protein